MHVTLQRKRLSSAEVRDAELSRGELHCCHLLAEVRRHHMLTEDQNRSGVVGGQQVLIGAPLMSHTHTHARAR